MMPARLGQDLVQYEDLYDQLTDFYATPKKSILQDV